MKLATKHTRPQIHTTSQTPNIHKFSNSILIPLYTTTKNALKHGSNRQTQSNQKKCFFVIFLLTLFEYTLKYPYVCQQANANRQQAPVIADNRTFSYQQIHAKISST